MTANTPRLRARGIFLVTIALCSGAAPGHPGRIVLAQGTGPSAAYAFSADAGSTTPDASGNGNTGTLMNGAAWTAAGYAGGGLNLDGVNDGVQLPESATLQLTTAFTLEAWVKPTTDSGYRYVVQMPSAEAEGLRFNPSGNPHFEATFTSGFVGVSGPDALSLNTWSHLALSYDGAALRLYVNGGQVASQAATGSLTAVTPPTMWLGRTRTGNAFGGGLDEVRIYQRALTASEILNDMTAPIDEASVPLTIATRVPASNALGVLAPTVRIVFNKVLATSTVTAANFKLTEVVSGQVVTAPVSYDAATRTVTLTPSTSLSAGQSYRVEVVGGPGGVQALSGGTLAVTESWTFTRAQADTIPSAAYAFSADAGSTTPDASGNGNTGTLKNGAAWTAGGYAGGGLNLDGVNDGVQLPVSDTLQLTTAFTLEAWVKPTSDSAYRYIVQMPSAEAEGLRLNPNGYPHFEATFPSGYAAVSGAGPLPLNVWSHLGLTYDGAALRLYVNGGQVASQAATGALTAATPPTMWLGRTRTGNAFGGVLDEVRIYRRALTASEIVNDMTAPVDEASVSLAIANRKPASNALGVLTPTVRVTFNKALVAGTVTATNFTLTDTLTEQLVTAPVSYDAPTRTVTLNPAGLTDGRAYRVQVVGGAAGVQDLTGGTLAASESWIFTRAQADTVPSAAYAFSADAGSTTPDASGNGNTGTLVNGPVWTASGYAGGGLTFDGVNDGVRLPESDTLQLTTAFTLEAWVKPTTSSGYRYIVQMPSAEAEGLRLNPEGDPHFEATFTSGYAAVYGPGPLPLNAWSHLGLTFDGAMLRLYVNGGQVASRATTGTLPAATPPTMWLGRTRTGNPFGGVLDEVRIYRRALTASEIASDMTAPNFGTLAAPTFSPAAGTYTGFVSVRLAALAGATIRYTTDGSTPTGSSPVYTQALVLSATTTVKAIAMHPDYTTSAVASATYTVQVGAPVFNPIGGTYAAGQTITVTTATPGATIRYTTNGAEPTQSDPVIASGGTLMAGNFTLKARAWKTGAVDSATTTGAYAITGSLTSASLGAGLGHSLAVRSDGVAWAWGYNAFGQLGDGTTTQRPLPVIVNGVTGAKAIAGGQNHSLVVRTDGTGLGWGENAQGQLGDNTTTGRLLAVSVSGLTTATAVAAGYTHAVARKSDNTIVAWGGNAFGQVGDGSTTQRNTPVAVSGLTGVIAVTAGNYFTAALKSDGTVWTWGRNDRGQLGDGTAIDRWSPVQVSGLSNVVSIAAGGTHMIAVKNDGTVWTWGYNGWGQLGDGTFTDRSTPVIVSSITSATGAAGGVLHSLVLKSDGSVLAFGYNASGQLGDGTTTNRATPVSPIGLPAMVKLAAAGEHSLALTADDTVWSWGYNFNGQLGDGTTATRSTPTAISGPGMAWSLPAPTLSIQSGVYTTTLSVVVTSVDPAATLRYTTNGATPTAADPTVASGGTVAVNQSLTLKVNAWKTGSPTSLVTSATYVLKAVAPTFSPSSGSYGTSQTVSISTTTSGATIRYTADGTEPTSSSTAYSAPIAVAETSTIRATAFKTGWSNSDSAAASYWIAAGTVATPTFSPAAGAYTSAPLVSLATTTSGATIRYTVDGSEPTGSSALYVYPFVVNATTTVKARAFKTGYTASSTATATYSVDAAGAVATPAIVPGGGRYATKQTVTITGPAGATLRYTTTGVDPTETDATVASGGAIVVDRPQVLKVKAFQSGLTPSVVRRADYVITGALSAGDQHSLALKSDGTVWAWGYNGSGQLGDGTGQQRLTPVQVLTNATAIAAGKHHTLAVKTDGSVWSWGYNASGQLGDGTTSSRLSPVAAVGVGNVVAVAAGTAHSLALKADGTVWAWGANASGQLGDGTTTMRSSPVQVIGLSGVTAIAAGEDFSLAVQSDNSGGGFVWAWGHNASGQLGDGSTVNRSVPARVGTLTSGLSVAAGRDFALLLKSDGTVWAWGANAVGQLGIGSTTASLVPLQVNPLARVVSIAAGTSHALALDGQGRLWAWGDNTQGQLGEVWYTNTGPNSVPQRVQGVTAPTLAATGGLHTLVAKTDGTVWGVGSNTGGQLGDGTTASANVLVASSGLTLATNTWLMGDADADGLITWREYLLGTDPLNADTNGNGLADGVDEGSGGTPANPDTDADGSPNWVEVAKGTDPFNPDSDGDGVNDGTDAFPLDPTRSQTPAPTPGDTTPPTITLKEPVSARIVP